MRAQFVIPVLVSILILGSIGYGVIAYADNDDDDDDDNKGKSFEKEITDLLNQIQIDVANIISLLTDPIFGLEEIKNEIIIIDQKVDEINAKVDTLDNSDDSGVKRMYVTLKCDKPLVDALKCKILTPGHNQWILQLRCPDDNRSCGPMKVDSIHFVSIPRDFAPIGVAVLNELCVDVNKSCTKLTDAQATVEVPVLGGVGTNGPLIPILSPGNILIRSGHGGVDAYFIEIDTIGRWFGDVRIGVIIPDGSNVFSPTHRGDRIDRNIIQASAAGLPPGIPGV